MKYLLALFFVLTSLDGRGFAESFTIGETKLEIPAPAGFVRVTPEMSAAYQYAEQMANSDPEYKQFGYYIPKEDAPAALEGKLPPRKRYFFLRVLKRSLLKVNGIQDFEESMENLKESNNQVIADVRAEDPELFDELIEGIKMPQADQDLVLKVTQFLPFKEHFDTPHLMSFSMLYSMSVSSVNASLEDINACTMTHLNPAGKMLLLFCYAPQDELEWTRDTSKSWADAILASNPPAPEGSLRGYRPSEGAFPSEADIKIIISVILVFIGLLYLLRKVRVKTI